MSNYCNEDDWQIELRRLKAERQYKVCRLNCGYRLTTRFVLLCCICSQSKIASYAILSYLLIFANCIRHFDSISQ